MPRLERDEDPATRLSMRAANPCLGKVSLESVARNL